MNERCSVSGNIRNLAMEKVASSVMFPCKYQSSGCTVSLLHTEKTDHEEGCEFRFVHSTFIKCAFSCEIYVLYHLEDLAVNFIALGFSSRIIMHSQLYHFLYCLHKVGYYKGLTTDIAKFTEDFIA